MNAQLHTYYTLIWSGFTSQCSLGERRRNTSEMSPVHHGAIIMLSLVFLNIWSKWKKRQLFVNNSAEPANHVPAGWGAKYNTVWWCQFRYKELKIIIKHFWNIVTCYYIHLYHLSRPGVSHSFLVEWIPLVPHPFHYVCSLILIILFINSSRTVWTDIVKVYIVLVYP